VDIVETIVAWMVIFEWLFFADQAVSSRIASPLSNRIVFNSPLSLLNWNQEINKQVVGLRRFNVGTTYFYGWVQMGCAMCLLIRVLTWKRLSGLCSIPKWIIQLHAMHW
jgi:hypothetical protein